jgi:hypothetical protein
MLAGHLLVRDFLIAHQDIQAAFGQAGDRSAVRSRPEQIPPVPGDVDENDDLSIRLLPRLGDELNAHAAHP